VNKGEVNSKLIRYAKRLLVALVVLLSLAFFASALLTGRTYSGRTIE